MEKIFFFFKCFDIKVEWKRTSNSFQAPTEEDTFHEMNKLEGQKLVFYTYSLLNWLYLSQ